MVRCRTGELYTGCTSDLKRRIAQHNRGAGSKFTRARRPVSLIYQELCGGKSAALRRELEIKGLRRSQKLALAAKPGAVHTASATTE
ncbi:MAG: GIY-YIG nuclease family protein [Thaumarchaeota archaeon]|nr:GIY-YIG nuclease family protein [Nitrososphaerota archaeon]